MPPSVKEPVLRELRRKDVADRDCHHRAQKRPGQGDEAEDSGERRDERDDDRESGNGHGRPQEKAARHEIQQRATVA